MNKKVKKRWVKALRSGKYDQTTEKLFDGENSFCCLGVLCDIQGIGEWEKMDNSTTWIFTPDKDEDPPSDGGGLPMWLLDEVGLSVNEEAELIALNDDSGFDFNQIADHIELTL